MNRKNGVQHKYYGSLCWQRFDYRAQRNSGSYHDGERLDGYCVGDIRVLPTLQRGMRRRRIEPRRVSHWKASQS